MLPALRTFRGRYLVCYACGLSRLAGGYSNSELDLKLSGIVGFGNVVPGAYRPVLAKQVPVIRSAAKATLLADGRHWHFNLAKDCLVARLKNRCEAVFAGHRFHDFHASVAGIDLFAGTNHSGPL